MQEDAMALIKCNECGNEVSSKAAACPRCSAPPGPGQPASPTNQSVSASSAPPPKRLRKTTVILALIAVALSGGLLTWYEIHAKRRAAWGAAATSGSPGGIPPSDQVSWADRASAAVTRAFDANGPTIAQAIKVATHPMGPREASLSGVEVRRAGRGLSVEVTVGWNGGMGLGDYTTVVVWNFDERQHRQATVFSDTSPFSPKNPGQLDGFFRDQVFPLVMSSMGE